MKHNFNQKYNMLDKNLYKKSIKIKYFPLYLLNKPSLYIFFSLDEEIILGIKEKAKAKKKLMKYILTSKDFNSIPNSSSKPFKKVIFIKTRDKDELKNAIKPMKNDKNEGEKGS